MKNYLQVLLVTGIFCCCLGTARGQGMAINTTGTAAASSAMLDVASTTKGLLTPRMTDAQIAAIASPATGLLVYKTDVAPGFYYYTGSAWVQISTATQPHMQVFTSPGSHTFTTSANITSSTVFKITVTGGGAGGLWNKVGLDWHNFGGGAGGTAIYVGAGLAPSTAYAVTVGAGTMAGAAATGGTSQVVIGTTTIAATGGECNGVTYNGPGGTATGGTLNITGGIGLWSYNTTGVKATSVPPGGSSYFGGGYGAGGDYVSNGQDGVVIIEWNE